MSYPNKATMSQRKRPTKKLQQQQQRPSIGFHHLMLTILTTSIIVFVLRQQNGSWFKNENMTLVKRDVPRAPRFSETDLTRLENMLAEQPTNENIAKAIRALKLNLFQQWIGANDNDAIRLDSRSVDHKGVYAAKRLRAGQIVTRVPLDRILTLDMVMETEIGKKLMTLNPSVHVAIGTYIALQRHNSSFEIYPYLRILPDDMDFMPVMADDSALKSLEGTSAWKIIVQRKNEIDDEWIRVSPMFPQLDPSEFLWGVLISMTRTAGISINGAKTAGLIPLLNDFRHAPSPMSTTTAKIVNGYYIISTTKAVDAGIELTRNYGARSAQIFYCDYADVPSAITSADSIRLEFSSKAYAIPEIENVIGSWQRTVLITADMSSPAVKQVLSYLRIRVATVAEWKLAQSLTEDLSHISFISDGNEQRAIAELSSTVQNLIESLNCTGPDEFPENALPSYEFAVEQARDMCSLEKDLAKVILERIPELHSQLKSLPARHELTPSGDPFIDAMHWVINGGAKMDVVEVVSYGGSHRGLIAKRDVPKGEPVMAVPLSHCITSIAAKRTALAQEALDNNVTLTAHAMMAAMLVHESRNPDSHWRHFLATFPPSFENLPIYYSDEELALLKSTRTLAFFKPYANEIHDDYEIVLKAAPLASASITLTFEEYRRARHIVDTRNFIFEANGLGKEHIMVPYVDFMNHDLEPNTVWKFDPDTATFMVSAHKAIPAGNALVTSYGDKGNGQLLIGYGFALPSNPFDKATLRLDSKSMCVVQKTFNTVDMADCFLKLRKRFSNEVELLQKMKEGAISGLARFEQTIEEDQALLDELSKNATTGNDRVKFCLLTRMGEKLVLKFWIETTEKLLQYYAGEVQRDELDPMFEQYFKVLENPEQHGSEVRGRLNGENAEGYVEYE